jgi:hypothetical protein
MSKRFAAPLLLTLALAACSNGGGATQAPTSAATTPAATSGATQAGATTGAEVDPNTVAGFCQLMTDTVTSNWPPADSAAAAVISPLLRNWSNIAAFAAIATPLLAVSDWTASMSIMNPVPAPPSDVAAAWDQIVAFQASNCGA